MSRFPPGRGDSPVGHSRLLLQLACALYAAPVLVMVVWALVHHSLRVAGGTLLAGALVAAVAAAVTRTWRVFHLWQFPLVILSALFVAYAVVFHMPPGKTLAQLLVGAFWEEVRGCFGLPVSRRAALLLAAWAGGYLYCACRLPSRAIFGSGSARVTRASVLLLLPLAAFVALDPTQLIDGLALDPIIGSMLFLGGTVPQVRAELRRTAVHKIPYQAVRRSAGDPGGGEEVHILVVGESARRDSWSVYGYRRATTPFLDSLRGRRCSCRMPSPMPT